jgi:CMP/dCMP kinase
MSIPPRPASGARTRIALSGQVGSGKSAVGTQLSAALGYSYLSTGAIQRAIAARRGVTTLELNQIALTDPSIDKEIDDYLKIDVNAMERVVIDSRMAFHFVTDAIKVTLVIDPEVAVARVMSANRAEEKYATVDIARHAIAERNRLERERYFKLYGVNTHDLANYDIVVNTSAISIDHVVAHLVAEIEKIQATS